MFEEKRAFLASGAPWPGEPKPEAIETHASIVFLTRDRAWKLKKPVRLVHVDQRLLSDRERLCREEVRLNREMSGDVYRGVTPLVQRPDGTLALGGDGPVIDWLIEAVRLPAAQMLNRRLASGPPPTKAEIAALGEVLVGFYRRQPPLPEEGSAFFDRLLRDTGIAERHLCEMAPATGALPPAPVLEFALPAIRICRGEILERARRGALLEGHGDLRAEHVCLTDPPVVFDRLEIDRTLRLVDPFFEIDALGLECRMRGGGWIGADLHDRLAQAFAPPSRRLLSAFGTVACLTRARIAADHFRDSVVADAERHRATTRAYLDLAAELVGQEPSG